MTAAFDYKLLRRLPSSLLRRLEPGPRYSGIGAPCLIWIGSRRSRNGYGRCYCKAGRKERQVHVQVYERVVGPVPPNYVLDHLCRVRLCAAPWHLEAVTVSVNTRRGNAVLFQSGAQV